MLMVNVRTELSDDDSLIRWPCQSGTRALAHVQALTTRSSLRGFGCTRLAANSEIVSSTRRTSLSPTARSLPETMPAAASSSSTTTTITTSCIRESLQCCCEHHRQDRMFHDGTTAVYCEVPCVEEMLAVRTGRGLTTVFMPRGSMYS